MTIHIPRMVIILTLIVVSTGAAMFVGGRIGRYIAIRHVAASGVQRSAYTLNAHWTDGNIRRIIARRGNGELAVLSTNIAFPTLGYVSRNMQLATGWDVTINEVLHTKSTTMVSTDQMFKRHQKQPYDPASQCTAHVDPAYLKEATFALEGVDNVLGLDVYRVSLKRKGQSKIAWRAPSLDCDEVRTINTTYDENGKPVRTNESIPDSIIMGEPSPLYFATEGYTETAPADVEIGWIRHFGGGEPPPAMIEQWRKLDERSYHPPAK